MHSKLHVGGIVRFPTYTGEKVYMEPFFQKSGLPARLSRWQRTVDVMLQGVETDGPIYIMIDQGIVRAGKTHRRPGVHIDGNWLEDVRAHGAPPQPGWRPPGSPAPGFKNHTQGFTPEALILASDVQASRAYVGEFDGLIGEGGDCSHLDLSRTRPVDLKAHRTYAGNVYMLHESLPVRYATPRTLVRLSVPGFEFGDS